MADERQKFSGFLALLCNESTGISSLPRGEGAVLKTVLKKSVALLVGAWRDHATFKSRDLERVV